MPRSFTPTSVDTAHPRPVPGVRFDARASLALVLVFSVMLFFVDTWMGMGAFALASAALLVLLRARIGKVLKCLLPLGFILAFTVVAHIPQGIDEGVFYALRILLLALGTLSVAFSYDNTQLVRAFSSFLSPLRTLHVPVDDIASMFSIALRFIPVSMGEFHRIAKAQRARAAKLDEGSVVERVKHWSSVLTPMLVGLFHRADILALGMEARCYGCAAKRTSIHGRSGLHAADLAFLLLGSSLCILAGILL